MSAELRIKPLLAGPGCMTLDVSGAGLPKVGRQLNRLLPQLDDQDLEKFRRGTLDVASLQRLSDQITQWLFDADLRPVLEAALPASGAGLRVVVEVPDAVRPTLWKVPFELVWHDAPDKPLVLRRDVQSLVYVLAKTQLAASPPVQSWPFKILLVRAFPPDLDTVPEVKQLFDKINSAGAHYGPGMIQVDVLSRETAFARPATWTAFRERLEETKDYNMLVFLGHGELVPTPSGVEPVGQLYLESEDGNGSHAVTAPQLARALSDSPVDVVVLAGCLTGANDAPRGGAQGVAQALVNSSEAGVQVAVAMRTELQTAAALTFLESFFRSLLNPRPDKNGMVSAGNIDCAVRKARNELFLGYQGFQWAAPVVLRAIENEPYIDYLAQPIRFRITSQMEKLLDIRATLWNGLADYSFARGVPERLRGKMDALDQIETMLREEASHSGPFVMPQQTSIPAGQSGAVVFELAGKLTLVSLGGRVIVGGGASVTGLALPEALRSDFQLLTDSSDPSSFELRSRSGAPRVVPSGAVLCARIDVGAASGVYRLALEMQRLQPPSVVWPGDGVLIVPGP